jgi:ferredoxin
VLRRRGSGRSRRLPCGQELRPRRSHVKVTVDYDVCASTGSCMQVCPEVFEVRSDGFLYVLQEEPPEELRPKVTDAAELCPTGAITVEG